MLNKLSQQIHKNNISKGFYESPKNIAEMLCLIHSEVSEALEADRNGKEAGENYSIQAVNGWTRDDDFQKSYKDRVKGTFEEEMADIIIRVLDLCAFKEIDIDSHVKAKMRYNSLREYKHGKKY